MKNMIISCLSVFFLYVAFVGKVDADCLDVMDRITDSVRKVCLGPTEQGEEMDLTVSGKGDVQVKLKSLKDIGAGLSGGATFSKKQWEGVRDVMQQPYTDCVNNLGAKWLENFGGSCEARTTSCFGHSQAELQFGMANHAKEWRYELDFNRGTMRANHPGGGNVSGFIDQLSCDGERIAWKMEQSNRVDCACNADAKSKYSLSGSCSCNVNGIHSFAGTLKN